MHHLRGRPTLNGPPSLQLLTVLLLLRDTSTIGGYLSSA